MWWQDFYNWLWVVVQKLALYMQYFVYWAWNAINWLWTALYQVAVFLWNGLVTFAKLLWRGLTALRHLRLADLWRAIKRGVERIRRALDWYYKRVIEPIDRLRRQIWRVYDRFFKPLLRMLDTFRVSLRILAIFNRKLAARLDSRLFSLEAKLMWPITATLRRVNELASHFRMITTARGYLDRTLLLESLRRDASLVLEVLTNPRARIFAPTAPAPRRTIPEIAADFQEYIRDGTGHFAAFEGRVREAYRKGLMGGL